MRMSPARTRGHRHDPDREGVVTLPGSTTATRGDILEQHGADVVSILLSMLEAGGPISPGRARLGQNGEDGAQLSAQLTFAGEAKARFTCRRGVDAAPDDLGQPVVDTLLITGQEGTLKLPSPIGEGTPAARMLVARTGSPTRRYNIPEGSRWLMTVQAAHRSSPR